jgi:hypothetical protein
VHINLHLTDDTQLRGHGYIAGGTLFAEVHWDFPLPGSRLGNGSLWGTPAMMRQLAALAVQAAVEAEEEAAWQAHTTITTAPAEGAQVA